MKKIIIPVAFLLLATLGFLFLRNKNKSSLPETSQSTIKEAEKVENEKKPLKTEETQQGPKIDYRSAFRGLLNPCEIFPKEKIEEISGKKILSVEFNRVPISKNTTQYSCSYYQEPPKKNEYGINIAKKISIIIVDGNLDNVRASFDALNLQRKEDKDIPFVLPLVYDEKGKFQRLALFLEDDLFLGVETWWSFLSEEEALKFVKEFVFYLNSLVKNQ